MAERKNGVARGVLALGDLTPETRPVTVVRDGKAVTLRGYVNGPRCPGLVKAEVASARLAWLDAIRQEDGASKHDPVAYTVHIRDSLLAIVVGLELAEADILAGNEEACEGLLRYLGWSDEEADADDPPDQAARTSTTATSSPTSSPPTASAPMSS